MLGLFALLIYQLMQELFLNYPRISKKVIECSAIVFLLIIFFPNVYGRIKAGLQRINEPYYFLNEPTVLKNIALTKGAAYSFSYAYGQIEQYFNNNPQGNVINVGTDPLFLTFDQRIKISIPYGVSKSFAIKSIRVLQIR